LISLYRDIRTGIIDQSTGKIFYGWYIALSGIVIITIATGLINQAFGAYFVLLQADFGWSKTLLSSGYAFARVESGVLGPVQGWLIDRYGPRIIMTIGLLIYGLGFIAFSQISSPLTFIVTFAIMSVGSSLGGFMALQVAVVNWFNIRRGRALILLSVGLSMAGFTAPIVAIALDYFSWRSVAIGSGLIVLFVGLPLAQLVRHHPHEKNTYIDGIINNDDDNASNISATPSHQSNDLTPKEALKTQAFWFISLGHAAGVLVVSAIMVHMIPHLIEELDYSLSKAGLITAIIPFAMLLGRFTALFFGEKYDKRKVVVVAMLGHTIALLLLAYAQSTWMVVLFALIIGTSWATRGPLTQALRADYFGTKAFGTIMGFSSMIVMIGSIAGPIVAGVLADVTGDYKFGFTLLAILAGLGSVFFLTASPPKTSIQQN
jgi:sugar phosphate permease|tara:strand:+ start:12590 stop:13885 length:1296 start_codon:yes stop_codon:yes gene_type:complete